MQGFARIKGVDHDDTYSPITACTTLRSALETFRHHAADDECLPGRHTNSTAEAEYAAASKATRNLAFTRKVLCTTHRTPNLLERLHSFLESQGQAFDEIVGAASLAGAITKNTPTVKTAILSNDDDSGELPASAEKYRQLVGKLNHLATAMRPDIAYAVDDPDGRKSTSGCIANIEKATVNWRSKKQIHVGVSITEAKYVAGAETPRKLTYTCCFLELLTNRIITPTLNRNNQVAIKPTDHTPFRRQPLLPDTTAKIASEEIKRERDNNGFATNLTDLPGHADSPSEVTAALH
ncbi:hypothetical protein EV182_007011, partial [Spiromyces aspiralis]